MSSEESEVVTVTSEPDYIVVEDNDRENLINSTDYTFTTFTQKVTDKMKEGYQPTGGILAYSRKGEGYQRYLQSMFKPATANKGGRTKRRRSNMKKTRKQYK